MIKIKVWKELTCISKQMKRQSKDLVDKLEFVFKKYSNKTRFITKTNRFRCCKFKTLNVACGMLLQKEEEVDESNLRIENTEIFIVDEKIIM